MNRNAGRGPMRSQALCVEPVTSGGPGQEGRQLLVATDNAVILQGTSGSHY